MHLFTNKLLSIPFIIWLAVVAFAFYPVDYTSDNFLSSNKHFVFSWIATITCGMNISGVIAGFFELKKDLKISLIGITGNFLMIIVYLALVVFRDLWVEEIYIR